MVLETNELPKLIDYPYIFVESSPDFNPKKTRPFFVDAPDLEHPWMTPHHPHPTMNRCHETAALCGGWHWLVSRRSLANSANFGQVTMVLGDGRPPTFSRESPIIGYIGACRAPTIGLMTIPYCMEIMGVSVYPPPRMQSWQMKVERLLSPILKMVHNPGGFPGILGGGWFQIILKKNSRP